MKNFEIIYSNVKLYKKMLADIKSAKKSIYLETYIYDKDKIGNKFLKALINKAKQGVKIKLLIDAWGSTAKKDYFEKLIKLGGDVRFFREFRYVIRVFTKNHERNHRKLLIIDNNIGYIGSSNICHTCKEIRTYYNCLKWRETNLRIEGGIVASFTKSFMHSWEFSGKLTPKRIKRLFHKGFEIIQDIPSPFFKPTEREYIRLINKAEKEILIETPYLIPSIGIRQAFYRAVKRGVDIKIMIPHFSDVQIADLIRNRYLGKLYEKGINIYYYPKILHSKLLVVDNNFFLLGSSNLDYRSFMHQYEINLLGIDKRIISQLKKNFNKTLKICKPFDYEEYKHRSSIRKLLEMILAFSRKYL